MNTAYDTKKATAMLLAICKEREENTHSNLQLSKMFEADATYRAENVGGIWRLVNRPLRPEGNLEDEEVVVSFQGILSKTDMPPFNEKNIPSSKVKYMRQSAALTAFGNPAYNNLLANIAVIHTIFKRAIGERLIDDSDQTSSYTENPVTIDVANRYFVPKAKALPEDIRTLTTEVDPFGTLAKAAGSAYVHTEENRVYYFEKTIGSDGETIFRPTSPQTFQVGDIVEVQVSFIAVPIRDNKWKINKILRSISLFDGSYTQDAFVRGVMQRAPEERPKISLKRKVGYVEEQVSATRARMAEMHIDMQNNTPQTLKESENIKVD